MRDSAEQLFLTIRAGRDPATATPVLASTDRRAIRAAARALVAALGLDEESDVPVLAIHDNEP